MAVRIDSLLYPALRTMLAAKYLFLDKTEFIHKVREVALQIADIRRNFPEKVVRYVSGVFWESYYS